MKPKWSVTLTVFAAAALAAAFTFDVDNAVLKAHTDKLKQMPSITVTFTVNKIGSEVEDQKLVLSKSGLLRWETPSTITILSGDKIIRLDKKSNNYTEDAADAAGLKALYDNDAIWAWSALLDPNFTKPITAAQTGVVRKIKGVSVKELNVARGQKVVKLFIDEALGFARGSSLEEDKGGTKVNTLIVASEIVVGKEALAMSDKAFQVPAGSQKVEKSALAATFKDVSPIFAAKCGCHMKGAPSGLSLASYASTMKGGRGGVAVKPGDAKGSFLVGVINGTRTPKMPPQGSVSAEQLATLEKWINDGAKE